MWQMGKAPGVLFVSIQENANMQLLAEELWVSDFALLGQPWAHPWVTDLGQHSLCGYVSPLASSSKTAFGQFNTSHCTLPKAYVGSEGHKYLTRMCNSLVMLVLSTQSW